MIELTQKLRPQAARRMIHDVASGQTGRRGGQRSRTAAAPQQAAAQQL